ncbi:MAG TPA: hypothetical protein VHI50_02555 [Micromonosporaceae bacterium]|jgi:hypothetical protein|nr:hypothetical protein [Micromonosporaceae bacterium]
MWIHSPETLYTWATEHQRELIAEADRQRVLRVATQARRAHRRDSSVSGRAGRAGPGRHRTAAAAGA